MFRFIVQAGLFASTLSFGQTFFFATPSRFVVSPSIFDPGDSDFIPAGWIQGTGCPTRQLIAIAPSVMRNGSYMDAGCPTGDSSDFENEGLVLVKTGPTNSNAWSGAEIFGVQGLVLTELGYDFRRGLHCTANSPRFVITTMDNKTYLLGCSFPATTTTPNNPYPPSAANGWSRLRWGGSSGLMATNAVSKAVEKVTSPVRRLQIIFDEGQDSGPDFTGLAILDNLDVNANVVGQGPRGFIF